jgi:hypothetical protein
MVSLLSQRERLENLERRHSSNCRTREMVIRRKVQISISEEGNKTLTYTQNWVPAPFVTNWEKLNRVSFHFPRVSGISSISELKFYEVDSLTTSLNENEFWAAEARDINYNRSPLYRRLYIATRWASVYYILYRSSVIRRRLKINNILLLVDYYNKSTTGLVSLSHRWSS